MNTIGAKMITYVIRELIQKYWFRNQLQTEKSLRDLLIRKTFGPVKITFITEFLFLPGMTRAGS